MDGKVNAKLVDTIKTPNSDIPIILCWSWSLDPRSIEHYRKAQEIIDAMDRKPTHAIVGIRLTTPIQHPFLKGIEHWALCPVWHGDLVWLFQERSSVASKLNIDVDLQKMLDDYSNVQFLNHQQRHDHGQLNQDQTALKKKLQSQHI